MFYTLLYIFLLIPICLRVCFGGGGRGGGGAGETERVYLFILIAPMFSQRKLDKVELEWLEHLMERRYCNKAKIFPNWLRC